MDNLISIKNRSNGNVVYTIPMVGDRSNVRREFSPREVQKISPDELTALSFIPGGMKLIENYLQILDENAKDLINLVTEPEYDMSEDDIKDLLLNGSLDKFLDCLDFAPRGVTDLIKKYAVELEINDVKKRKAIQEKLGFNVDSAIDIIQKEKEAGAEKEEVVTPKKERRQPIPPKYDIVE